MLGVALEGNRAIYSEADDVILVPRMDNLFVVPAEIVPLQLFAYYVAKANGCAIDKPKNLAKSVTVRIRRASSMPNQSVIVLDFGGQYNQLIARRVRECNVYCEVKPHTMSVDEIRAFDPIGIIFTGGPQSVYAEGSPQVDPEIFQLGIPILGICYGCQLMAQYLGGEVTAAGKDTAREYGKTQTWFDTDCRLFRGLPEQSITWMSHGDYMAKVPESFRLVAHSAACPTVGICDEARGFYGVQFHPEVNHTEYGQAMLRNFLYEVCGAAGDWTMGDFMRKSIESIRAKVGDGKVLLALSGGVDSSVAAALLAEAVGSQLTCIFVDHGLLRKNEATRSRLRSRTGTSICAAFNAEERFLIAPEGRL